MIERICKQCGKVFLLYPSDIKKGGGSFCCKNCRDKYQVGKNNPSFKQHIKCICKLCGKEFEILPCDQRKGRGTFCSHKCYTKWAKENMTNIPLSQSHKDKISIATKGKVISKLQRDKISNTLKKIYSDPANTPMYNKHHSIESRKKMSDAQSGEKSKCWKGGISFEPYCPKFNNTFKERVRSFWNYTCFFCGKPQSNKKLHVHHIHYDKKMCCNGSPQDCIPLCNSCHSKTGSNRDHWEKLLTDKLYSINPNGKCFYIKEEYYEMVLKK